MSVNRPPSSSAAPEQPTEQKSAFSSLLRQIAFGSKTSIAGAAAGITSKLIVQPLDLIRTRMQTQTGKGGVGEYSGIRHAIRSVLAQEGLRGLYTGLTPNLIGSGVGYGVYFTVYKQAKVLWSSYLDPPTLEEQLAAAAEGPKKTTSSFGSKQRLGPLAHLLCAATAGVGAALATNPVWIVKTRLQLQARDLSADSARRYRGVTDAWARIVREEGPLALYRGIGPSLSLVSTSAIQFMLYEELRAFVSTHLVAGGEEALNTGHFLAMGAAAKGLASSITYPLAVTRSRLYQRRPEAEFQALSQAERAALKAANRADFKYVNAADVWKNIIRHEGWRGFYRGLVPQLLKTAPAASITFLCFETYSRALDDYVVEDSMN